MTTPAVTDDEVLLARMGYRQEFPRTFRLIHNFGVALTHISLLAGVGTLFGYSLAVGGPAGAVWSWILVSILSTCVALAMAEICSAYPTAGGLYYWSAKLGGEKYGPVLAWYTGWFNLTGEIGAMAGTGYGCSQLIFSCVLANNPDFDLPLWKIALLAICILYWSCCINCISDKLLERIMELSVFIHTVGPIVIIIICLAVAPTRQSGSFVFTQLENQTGQDSQGLAVLLGFLMPAWTLIGYDAAAHVSEETQNAHREAARGILWSVLISAILGFVFLLGLLFSIQDIDAILTAPYPQPLMQLFVDASAGNLKLATFLMCILIAAMLCCAVAVVTSNSRMVYAFCRDGGLGHLLSTFLYWSHPTSRLPIRTIWFGPSLSVLVLCISFGSVSGMNAAASIATVGLMTAYVIPTFAKLTFARDTFKRGEFHLGRFSVIVGWVAVFWVAFLFVLLCIPSFYPVTAQNLNYTSVMIGGVTIFATIFWVLSANQWFHGPIARVSAEELTQMEDALAAKKAAVES